MRPPSLLRAYPIVVYTSGRLGVSIHIGVYTDTTSLVLTGEVPFILIASATLAFPISFALIRLYRHTVLETMVRVGAKRGSAPPPLETRQPAPIERGARPQPTILEGAPKIGRGSVADALCNDASFAPWRAAAVYGAAGAAYAVVMTACYHGAKGIPPVPMRCLFLFWIYAWPVVLAVNLVAASTRRAKLAAVGSYCVVFGLIGAVALARNRTLTVGQISYVWLWMNLPATLLLLGSLHRSVRAVGPLVVAFVTLAVTGTFGGVSLLQTNHVLFRSVAGAMFSFGLSAGAVFVALHLAGLALFAPIGWLVLQWIRDRYERKQISDQSLTLDAVWLLFGVAQSIELAFEGPAWGVAGLGGFALYKIVSAKMLPLLYARVTRRSPRLLLLRVFSLGKESQRFFDVLDKRWRHVGSIQMIAGPDLATTTVEPHEFLDFLRGRLTRRFIDGPQALDLRLAEMDLERDRDGRFRVNDFFCREETWKTTLSRLVNQSEVVLMDLRRFSPQNAGCIFEISTLIDVMPVDRVVFVIDNTTDESFLRETIQCAWSQIPLSSPNRQCSPSPLRLFRLAGKRGDELRQLFHVLCVAAAA
jgi:hypothetical protein